MKPDTALDVPLSHDRDEATVAYEDCGADAGIQAWLTKQTTPLPHATIWFDEAYAACSLWCELRGFAKPSAETFRKSILAHGCEIDRERSLAGSQKHYDYVIVHLRMGRSAFTQSTLDAFESQRRRRATAAKSMV